MQRRAGVFRKSGTRIDAPGMCQKGAEYMAVTGNHQNGTNGHTRSNAVLYARVSSEEQARRESIETQIHVAQQQCEREGITLTHIYRDEGVSGTVPFEQRPGGKQVLADARAKKFPLVLLYKVDRLGRSDVVSHVARHHLETLGVGLRSLTEPFDTTTPHGRFMFSILAAQSAMERENIRERSIAGIERSAKAGRWLGGSPPRGYKITPERKLVPDTDLVLNGKGITEAELILMIYRWIGDERCSTNEVAKRFNEQKIPVTQIKRGGRRRGSGVWLPRTIAVIVKNPLYRGEYVFRRRLKKNGAQELRYAVPALVAPELWQRAQNVIAANWHHRRSSSHREYLLRGLVRCGLCGMAMSGMSGRGKDCFYFFYRCQGKKQELSWIHGWCPARLAPALKLESLVWDELARWILDGKSLDKALAAALKDVQGERDQLQQRLTKARTKLESLEHERQRAISLCRQGSIDDRDLEKQLTEVAQERQAWHQTIAALEQQLSSEADPHAALAQFHAQLARFQKDIRKGALAPEEKRKIFETLVTEVRVFGKIRKRTAEPPVIHQVIPFRATLSPEPEAEGKTILWQRTGASAGHEEEREKVQIIYTFPFTPGEQAVTVLRGTTPPFLEG